jgi:hypothetical protein
VKKENIRIDGYTKHGGQTNDVTYETADAGSTASSAITSEEAQTQGHTKESVRGKDRMKLARE